MKYFVVFLGLISLPSLASSIVPQFVQDLPGYKSKNAQLFYDSLFRQKTRLLQTDLAPEQMRAILETREEFKKVAKEQDQILFELGNAFLSTAQKFVEWKRIINFNLDDRDLSALRFRLFESQVFHGLTFGDDYIQLIGITRGIFGPLASSELSTFGILELLISKLKEQHFTARALSEVIIYGLGEGDLPLALASKYSNPAVLPLAQKNLIQFLGLLSQSGLSHSASDTDFRIVRKVARGVVFRVVGKKESFEVLGPKTICERLLAGFGF